MILSTYTQNDIHKKKRLISQFIEVRYTLNNNKRYVTFLRPLLDAKKQRLCRHLSSSSSSSSTLPDQVHSSTIVGEQSFPSPPSSTSLALEVNT